MEPTRAIVRKPGPAFVHGITTATLGEPDWEKALVQHEAYVQALRQAGLEVTVLDTEPDYPDCPFVEDTAVVVQEGAVITRPGAAARRGEERSVRAVLSRFLPTLAIQAPGTLEGGDVLRAGDRFVIGLTARTNQAGATQLKNALERFGYSASLLPVSAYLHLKTGVNYIGENTVLVTRALANEEAFRGFERVIVDEREEYAANSISVRGTLIMPRGFPRLRDELMRRGRSPVELDMTEFQKLDGGLTCLSLIF